GRDFLTLAEHLLRPGQVVSVHPYFGRQSRDITDAGIEKIAHNLAADSFDPKCFLPDMRLRRIGCRNHTHDFIARAFHRHQRPSTVMNRSPSPRNHPLSYAWRRSREPGLALAGKSRYPGDE